MSRWQLLGWLIASATAAGTAAAYSGYRDTLPERVPVHWGIDGRPDGFTTRDGALPGLMILPAVMLGVAALTSLLGWLSPRGFPPERHRPALEAVCVVVLGLFAYLQVVIGLATWQKLGEPAAWMAGGVCLGLAVLGLVMTGVKRNYWVGVRTPWTLSSEAVWDGTHKVGGPLLAASGVTGFVAAVAGAQVWVPLALVLTGALLPVGYSLWLYKRLERGGRLGA